MGPISKIATQPIAIYNIKDNLAKRFTLNKFSITPKIAVSQTTTTKQTATNPFINNMDMGV
jgi:hypothetical protein